MKLNLERAETAKYHNQSFVTRLKVQKMIFTEVKKSTPYRNVPVLTGMVEETLIEAQQVGCNYVKGGVKPRLA